MTTGAGLVKRTATVAAVRKTRRTFRMTSITLHMLMPLSFVRRGDMWKASAHCNKLWVSHSSNIDALLTLNG